MTGVVTCQFYNTVKEEVAGGHGLRMNEGDGDRCENEFTLEFVKRLWQKTVCHMLLLLHSLTKRS